MTTIKIVYESEIRRFKLDQNTGRPFEQVSKVIREGYGLDSFELKYVDDEQDYCLITSEEEIAEALRLVSKDKVLKLFAYSKELAPVKAESKIELPDEPLKLETPLPKLEVVDVLPTEVTQVVEPQAEVESQAEAELQAEVEPQATEAVEPQVIDEKLDVQASDSQVEAKEISSSSDTIHDRVACEGCEQQPIRGLRFICTSCKDYNLCSSCESKNEHPQDHVLLKAKVPLPNDFALTSPFPKWVLPTPQIEAPSVRPRAHFVRDVTMTDGSSWRSGQRAIKIWSLKNVGKVCWPRGTKLVFVSGMIKPIDDEEQPLVPLAAPGEVVDVSIKVQIPEKPGRYMGYYRLSYGADGIKFGHRIWLDVFASEPSLPEVGIGGVMRREMKSALGKAFDAVSRLVKPEKSSASQENHEVKKLEKQPQQPQQPQQQPPVQEIPEAKKVNKEEPVVGTGPIATAPVSQPKFQYEIELQTLADMGFDMEMSKAALLKHKGNLNMVIHSFLA